MANSSLIALLTGNASLTAQLPLGELKADAAKDRIYLIHDQLTGPSQKIAIKVWESKVWPDKPGHVNLRISIGGKIDPRTKALLPWMERQGETYLFRLSGWVSLPREVLSDAEWSAFTSNTGKANISEDEKASALWWMEYDTEGEEAEAGFSFGLDVQDTNEKGPFYVMKSIAWKGLVFRGRGISNYKGWQEPTQLSDLSALVGNLPQVARPAVVPSAPNAPVYKAAPTSAVPAIPPIPTIPAPVAPNF